MLKDWHGQGKEGKCVLYHYWIIYRGLKYVVCIFSVSYPVRDINKYRYEMHSEVQGDFAENWMYQNS